MRTVWDAIETTLVQQNMLPHNALFLKSRNTTPTKEAKRKVAEIRSGLSTINHINITGPALLLRVVGPRNRSYSGEWWFDASLLNTIESAHSRLYFNTADKKRALQDMLREVLAVSYEWNPMTEIWALALPVGQSLAAYTGPGNPQKLFADLPLSEQGNRMLIGKARQIYVPVKNPLWVMKYQNLS